MALALSETAEQIMRQNLIRRDPDASPTEIQERIQAWYLHRPGAEHGDGVGKVRPRNPAE